MGILLSERTEIFHVPYGPLCHDGDLNTGFIDLKANLELIPVLPPCIGWPETQDLLRNINAPLSPFMSLATHQSFVDGRHQDQPVMLIFFVTLCLAEITHKHKSIIADLATFLHGQMDHLLQDISESLQQPLHLEIVLESQPTVFHAFEVDGWSLTIFIAASGQEHHRVRGTWGWGVHAFIDALERYHSLESL
ncbi:MAG: hypothetical protein E4H32_04725 [Nitrospirales bacterium]|nr:MAG: hypothetical protein E4H32_04725 [Nitrospirales bacterium]